MRASLDAACPRKRWRARNPAKDAAHRAVEMFVRRLRRMGLSKPNCEACGVSEADAKAAGKTIQGHHASYDRPLDVTWLCCSCHIAGHWSTTWRAERNGKAVVYMTRTTVVETGPQ